MKALDESSRLSR